MNWQSLEQPAQIFIKRQNAVGGARQKNATQTAATDLVYMQRRRSAPDKKPVVALRGSEISRRPESHKKRTVRLAV